MPMVDKELWEKYQEKVARAQERAEKMSSTKEELFGREKLMLDVVEENISLSIWGGRTHRWMEIKKCKLLGLDWRRNDREVFGEVRKPTLP